MDPAAAANSLSDFERRLAGSDAERRAALELRRRLIAAGRAAEIEPFRFHQRCALAEAIALGAAVVGSVLSVTAPVFGTALVAVAALCSMLEATGAVELLSRATGTRASQNVSSPPAGDTKPGLLVVAAGYDAPRATAFARVAERVGAPWRLLGAALVAVLACCVLRLLDFEGDVLTAIQLVPTLLLLAALPLLIDVELSPVGDGAAEAAGVEVAIALAERLDGELERLDVWLVLAGAQGARGAGMRRWRRLHRAELGARPTVTIEVGAPEPDAVAETRDRFHELAHRLDRQLER